MLAHTLHLSLTFTFKAVVLVIAALSAFVAGTLLLQLRQVLSRAHLWFLAFVFIALFGAAPARDFGQRDHLLTLLILPYLVAAALHAIGDPLPYFWRITFTLIAAMGIALKPHQALIPIAVELTVLLLRRRPRLLQTALFLLAGAGYYAAIRLLAPTWFIQVLPLLRDTYWAFGSLTLPQLLAAAPQLDLLAAAALTLYLTQGNRRRSPLTLILLAAGTAAFLAYLLQGTGWYYQQLPSLSLFGLALAIELIDLVQYYPIAAPAWLPYCATALAVLALSLATWFSDFHRTPHGLEQPQPTPDPAFYAGLTPGTAVATLTTTVDDTVAPADRYQLTLAQRYPHLWLLPALLRGPAPHHPLSPARLAALTALQQRFMVEDLERWHPTLILVARCQDPAVHCQVLEDRHDNLLAFFLRDPRFQQIFTHYHFQQSLGPYDAYRLN